MDGELGDEDQVETGRGGGLQDFGHLDLPLPEGLFHEDALVRVVNFVQKVEFDARGQWLLGKWYVY